MKIVVLDGYTENPGDLSWASIAEYGELTVYDRTPYQEEEIIRRIGDADVIFTNKCPISKNTLDACPNLKFISVLATGYNVVDTAYAAQKGIPVSNIPTYGTASVGQFAIALLLEICHHVQRHSDAVHEGKWESNPDWCFWDYPLIELAVCNRYFFLIQKLTFHDAEIIHIKLVISAKISRFPVTEICSVSRKQPLLYNYRI